nr:MAG TPA: hypothetical protein [Caudoviricetes sp.]
MVIRNWRVLSSIRLFLVQKIFIKIEISTCFYVVNDV